MSKDWVKDLEELHAKFNPPCKEQVALMGPERLAAFLAFRFLFLEEELRETLEATTADDVVDGLIDLCVVAVGTLDAFGVDGHKAWEQVHTANMAKVCGETKRQGGFGMDLQKPEGWEPPHHFDNVGCLDVAVMSRNGLAMREENSRPKVVCLCGSSFFKEAFVEANKRLTLEGKVVLSIGMFGHHDGLDMDGPVKKMLDKLHLAKINMADEVLILNEKAEVCSSCGKRQDSKHVRAKGHCYSCHQFVNFITRPYIGESTRREIEHAVSKGKSVHYLNEPEST